MATVANDLGNAEKRKESVSSLEAILLDMKQTQERHIREHKANIKALDYMLDLLAKNPQIKEVTEIAERLRNMGLNL